MHAPVKVKGNVHGSADRCSQICDPFNDAVDFGDSVDNLQLTAHIAFEGVKAAFLHQFCTCGKVAGPVAAYPAVATDPVPDRTAQQTVNRRTQITPLDVPQCHVDAGNCTHEHRSAPVTTVAIEHLPNVFDPSRILPYEEFGKLADFRRQGLRMPLKDRFSPSMDPTFSFNPEKQPAGRNDIGIELCDFHVDSTATTEPHRCSKRFGSNLFSFIDRETTLESRERKYGIAPSVSSPWQKLPE